MDFVLPVPGKFGTRKKTLQRVQRTERKFLESISQMIGLLRQTVMFNVAVWLLKSTNDNSRSVVDHIFGDAGCRMAMRCEQISICAEQDAHTF